MLPQQWIRLLSMTVYRHGCRPAAPPTTPFVIASPAKGRRPFPIGHHLLVMKQRRHILDIQNIFHPPQSPACATCKIAKPHLDSTQIPASWFPPRNFRIESAHKASYPSRTAESASCKTIASRREHTASLARTPSSAQQSMATTAQHAGMPAPTD